MRTEVFTREGPAGVVSCWCPFSGTHSVDHCFYLCTLWELWGNVIIESLCFCSAFLPLFLVSFLRFSVSATRNYEPWSPFQSWSTESSLSQSQRGLGFTAGVERAESGGTPGPAVNFGTGVPQARLGQRSRHRRPWARGRLVSEDPRIPEGLLR